MRTLWLCLLLFFPISGYAQKASIILGGGGTTLFGGGDGRVIIENPDVRSFARQSSPLLGGMIGLGYNQGILPNLRVGGQLLFDLQRFTVEHVEGASNASLSILASEILVEGVTSDNGNSQVSIGLVGRVGYLLGGDIERGGFPFSRSKAMIDGFDSWVIHAGGKVGTTLPRILGYEGAELSIRLLLPIGDIYYSSENNSVVDFRMFQIMVHIPWKAQ